MKKRHLFALIAGIVGCVQAESFYQNYTQTGTNDVAVTNLGVNPMFVSGISCHYVSNVTGTVTIKYNNNTLYAISLASNTSYYVTKSDLAGVWLKQNDRLSITSIGTTNTTTVSTEENR